MFQKAQRKRAFIKLAIVGPSGGGKTYSALRLAFGLGERVAMIDTENRSGELYADVNRDGIGEFDHCAIAPPFTVKKYVEAIRDAERARYDVLIIDSLTHAWAGQGGLLEQKTDLDNRNGGQRQNQFANWGPIDRQHEEFKAAILQSQIHIIATMRSKQEYQQVDGGKVLKLGMAPVQRDGMDYEFTLVFDVATDHRALPTKDRTNLFVDWKTGQTLTPDHGRTIRAWLDSGMEAPAAPQPIPAPRPAPAAPRVESAVRSGEREPSFTGAAVPPTNANACSWSGCGKPMTPGQVQVSTQKFNRALCPHHQRDHVGGVPEGARPRGRRARGAGADRGR